ncbi:MAG: DinB family protein [Acidobacteriota bacterium]|nr:DinB family protein [Acidobacteriota bacterium]
MTITDDQGRPEAPVDAAETETLLGFLDYQRATFEWKTRGLDAAGMSARVGPTSMTLGGMMKHLALVEDWWFGENLSGVPASRPFDGVDFAADPDWDWRTGAEDDPSSLRELWADAVVRSRAHVEAALADGGLDRLAARRWRDGRTPTLRWIVCHMIEEYARHNGHADLIREAVDGSTGE